MSERDLTVLLPAPVGPTTLGDGTAEHYFARNKLKYM
jgi:hypothetical protein